MKRALLAFLAAVPLLADVPQAHAQAETRVSCTRGGDVVHREAFPSSEAQSRRLAIASKFPDAFCIFMDGAPAGGHAYLPSAGMDDGLAAALAVISSGETGRAYPEAFARSMTPEIAGGLAEGVKGLNLAIGVYRGVEMEDVLAHWRFMQSQGAVMAGFQPTVNVVGGVTVLSVEDVPDTLAASLCEEARTNGSGCLATY